MAICLFAPLQRKHDMNRHIGLILGLAAIALVATLASTAAATSLVIGNPSFEDVNQANNANAPVPFQATDKPVDFSYYDNQGNWQSVNDYWNGTLADDQWAQVVGAGGTVDAVGWRPTAAAFPSGLTGPASGSKSVLASDYATLTAAGTPPQGAADVAVVQNISVDNPVLGTLIPGATYTLTVAIGCPAGTSFTGATLGIVDGTVGGPIVTPEWDAPLGPGSGVFYDYTCTMTDADWVGKGFSAGDQLGILVYLSSSGANQCDSVATNVRMDVTLAPEPSSVVLLVAGALSLLAYAWRKRK
jgi:hypothetical protein